MGKNASHVIEFPWEFVIRRIRSRFLAQVHSPDPTVSQTRQPVVHSDRGSALLCPFYEEGFVFQLGQRQSLTAIARWA